MIRKKPTVADLRALKGKAQLSKYFWNYYNYCRNWHCRF